MRKGWFKIPGVQDGDRTLNDQLKGLTRLFEYLAKDPDELSVLDLGAAEGLIAAECMKAGARKVYGMEIVADHVKAAARLEPDVGRVEIVQQDLNHLDGVHKRLRALGSWDVMLALAILHKLRNPIAFLDAVMEHHRAPLAVFRMPESTPGYVLDARSGSRLFDINGRMVAHGYRLTNTATGHFNEWVGYYELQP